METFKVRSERERLLCYASGFIGSTLSNPGNVYTAEQLMKPAIRAAHKLIATIYDDAALEAILKDIK